MSHWTQQIGQQSWFWYFLIPLISVLLSWVFNSLAKHSRTLRLDDWIVGNDICIEAWGVNLGFLASTILNVTSQAMMTFLVVTIAQMVLLGCNSVLLRFSRPHKPWRVLASNAVGLMALVLAFLAWRL